MVYLQLKAVKILLPEEKYGRKVGAGALFGPRGPCIPSIPDIWQHARVPLGKNDAAIAASCEKASAGKLRKRAAASQIEEEESL